MQLRHTLATTAALVLFAGCSGNTTTPATPSGSALPEVRSYTDASGMTLSTMGLYRIHVDAQSLAASVEPVQVRAAQDNDDLYQLAINSFLRSNALDITDVEIDPDSVDITYAITHPFDAPTNLAGPATAANRADLGVSGIVCLLADVASATGNTYFDAAPDQVIANTDALDNADGYYRPAGLFDTGGTIATAFPYKVLVDETTDPRTDRSGVAISNGGDPKGNFDQVNFGWQQDNMGPARNEWTGYGVLHQGQVALNTLQIPVAYLGSNNLDLTVAVLVKYNDPRQGANGAERKANRLPASPADVTKFAYRMPHGAVDVERIEYVGESGGFVANLVSVSDLRFRVVDWDARANVGLDPLTSDAAVDTVVAGTEGAPALSVCIPGVTGPPNIEVFFGPGATDDDSLYGGDVGVDSGEPGDALFFTASIGKGTGTGEIAGTYTGMVKAVDVAAADAIALDENLVPLAVDFPEPIAYQAFTVEMGSNTWVRTSGDTGPGLGGVGSVSIDPTGNVYAVGNFTGSYDFGSGPFVSTAGTFDMFLVKYSSFGVLQWVRQLGGPGSDSASAVDATRAGQVWVSGCYDNTIDFGTGAMPSAGGLDAFLARFNSDGSLNVATRYGGTLDDVPTTVALTVDGTGVYTAGNFTGTINTGGASHPSAGAGDNFVRRGLTTNGNWVWSRAWGGTNSELMGDVAVSLNDHLYAGGRFSNTVDFGAGPRIASGPSDVYLVKLTPATGVTIWDRPMGGTSHELLQDVATDPFDAVLAVGTFQSATINFGGSPHNIAGLQDMFAVRYTDVNGYSWSRAFGSAGSNVVPYAISLTAGGQSYISGGLGGSVDFGGGAIASTSSLDPFFVILNPMGGRVTEGVLNGTVASVGFDVAAQPTSNALIIGGGFTGTTDFDPRAGVQSRSAGTSGDGFVLKLDSGGNW